MDDKTKQFCFEIYSTTNDKIKACKHDSEGKVIEGKPIKSNWINRKL